MDDGVGFEDFLHEGIVGGEAVVRAGGAGEEEAHRVPLVAESGLHANEDVAELFAVDEKVFSVGVEVPGGFSPIFLEEGGVGGELLVLADGHFVGNVEVWAAEFGFLVVDNFFNEFFRRFGETVDLVAFLFEVLEHGENGGENVEVGGGPHVAFVRGEAEDSDRHFLFFLLGRKKRGFKI